MTDSAKFLCAALAFFSSITFPCAQISAGELVILELFTSSQCEDTPPAEENLKRIAEQDADVIALGCHVTYFNNEREGSDFLALKDCDKRHIGYVSGELDLMGGTPSMAINGRFDTEGTNLEILRAGLGMVRKHFPLEQALFLKKTEKSLMIDLRAIELDKPAEIWLFSYESTHGYEGVVKSIRKLMEWDGRSSGLSVPLTDIKGRNIAVIIQESDHGPVLSAAKLEL